MFSVQHVCHRCLLLGVQDDARRMIAAADVDGDQQLGLAEFVAVSLASPLQRATFLRDLFEHFDSNNDQFVSKGVWRACLKQRSSMHVACLLARVS
jgi:Ca2+-binding EF-hand superfamily protein